jgi:HlyD family secretion protein
MKPRTRIAVRGLDPSIGVWIDLDGSGRFDCRDVARFEKMHGRIDVARLPVAALGTGELNVTSPRRERPMTPPTVATAAILLFVAGAAPQNAPLAPASAAGSAVAAWRGSLRATLDLDGTLVPADAAPIALWPEGYRGELLVLEVARHGSFVNEGDVLVRFETKEIDEQIRQAEFDLAQAERRLAGDDEERRVQEEADQSALARAEQEADWAARKLAGYLDKEKAFKLEEIRLGKQSRQYGIEDQQDELDQLEKMYREDELVDATEEIVLKRSRRGLAQTIAWARLSEQRVEYDLALAEAIRQEGLEREARERAESLDRLRRSTQVKQTERASAAERARFDLEKQRERLAHLEHDRDLLTIRAPRRGIVLHGEADGAPGAALLDRGSRASTMKTIMVVADPDAFMAVVDVPEKSIAQAKTGAAAEVKVEAAPGFAATGALDVAFLPTGRKGEENVYRAEIDFEKTDPRLRPRMRCDIAVVLEEVRDAVLIPKGAVVTRGERTMVRCASSSAGPFAERTVVLGPGDGTNVVVREGLSAGEFVQTEGSS